MPELLIEIGTEEIPASYLRPALSAISASLVKGLAAARLRVGEPTLLFTHRRLVVHLDHVDACGESVTEVRKGPPARAAFDTDGNPTKAALGFAAKQGLDPADLEVVETEKGAWVMARVTVPGEAAGDVVARLLPSVLRSVPFPKTMRWTGSELPFARPIRNLVVLIGEEVVPVEIAGLVAGRETAGHAFLSPERFALESADLGAYRRALTDRFVVVDAEERRERILAGITALAGESVAAGAHPDLLDEVIGMAEWPVVLEGAIEEIYLPLPVEVLETAMRVHLRFFPVPEADGSLAPRFLAVMDREADCAALVREGMERVLRSRLSDARFFDGEDAKRKLADLVADLDDKSLHRDLGSYGDKGKRLATLAAAHLLGATGIPAAEEEIRRAALLAKADLVTEMVGEFPELQGTIGRIYATRDGEAAAVAEAIEDHYRPRGPSDDLPRGPVGIVVALAEKLDNLAAFVSVAGLPSGSSDPFGLRRQAVGLLRIAIEKGVRFNLRDVVRSAAELALEGGGDAEDLTAKIVGFVKERFYQLLVDAGFRFDLVRAAMVVPGFDPEDCRVRIEALTSLAGEAFWPRLIEVVERTANITKDADTGPGIRADLLTEVEEIEVHRVMEEAREELSTLARERRYVDLGRRFEQVFGEPVHAFFEQVFVNVEDSGVRANRMALLKEVNSLFGGCVADLSRVERGGETSAT
jgi:glycyl-tRNA synthetase beta chain